MGIVYVLTNPSFEGYIKIGKTDDIDDRLRRLDNTSVPLPFRCVYAVEVENETEVEANVHRVFEDRRTRPRREFFQIDPQCAIAALKLTRGRDVTPKEDVGADEEGVRALEKATKRETRGGLISDAGLKVGDTLCYIDNPEITAKVVSEKKVLFEDEEMSVSRAARILKHRDGFKWKEVNGWLYWMFEGETISARRDRLRGGEEADEDD